jgi:hypothetical protein
MISCGKWAPLKLTGIASPPLMAPSMIAGDHTANRRKEKLRQNHRGWCTLTISAANGEQASTGFTARYGRYNIGNTTNCLDNFGGPVN